MTSGAVSLATCFDGRVVLANRAGAELGFHGRASMQKRQYSTR